MEDMDQFLIYSKEEIDIIRMKMELGILENYYKVKKYCFLNQIDRAGFNFNWHIVNHKYVSWKDYDRIIKQSETIQGTST